MASIIPILDEVQAQIPHHRSSNTASHIVPWQPGFTFLVLCRIELFNCYDVLPTDVVVVDSWIHVVLIVVEKVITGIEASIAKIETACEGDLLINDHYFFMMRPQKRHHSYRMPEHLNVNRIELLKASFGPVRIVFQER